MTAVRVCQKIAASVAMGFGGILKFAPGTGCWGAPFSQPRLRWARLKPTISQKCCRWVGARRPAHLISDKPKSHVESRTKEFLQHGKRPIWQSLCKKMKNESRLHVSKDPKRCGLLVTETQPCHTGSTQNLELAIANFSGLRATIFGDLRVTPFGPLQHPS